MPWARMSWTAAFSEMALCRLAATAGIFSYPLRREFACWTCGQCLSLRRSLWSLAVELPLFPAEGGGYVAAGRGVRVCRRELSAGVWRAAQSVGRGGARPADGELDAAYFHLYGIGREDAEYILFTF